MFAGKLTNADRRTKLVTAVAAAVALLSSIMASDANAGGYRFADGRVGNVVLICQTNLAGGGYNTALAVDAYASAGGIQFSTAAIVNGVNGAPSPWKYLQTGTTPNSTVGIGGPAGYIMGLWVKYKATVFGRTVETDWMRGDTYTQVGLNTGWSPAQYAGQTCRV